MFIWQWKKLEAECLNCEGLENCKFRPDDRCEKIYKIWERLKVDN